MHVHMCMCAHGHISVYTCVCVCVCLHMQYGAYQMDPVVKNLHWQNAGDVGDTASVPGSGRYPGEENGNPPVGRGPGGVFRLPTPRFVNKDCNS